MEKNAARRVLYRRHGANDPDASYPSVLLEAWKHDASTCVVLTHGYKRLNSDATPQWLSGYPLRQILERADDWKLIEQARQAYLDLETSLKEAT